MSKIQASEKPNTFESVGNGSVRYRFNVEEQTNEGGNATYLYDEVIVWQPFTANDITKAVIEYLWPASYEQKLLNEYNAAQLGVYDDDKAEKKIEEYKNFLVKREEVKNQIDEDIKTYEK
jgi:hypothetical protein